MLKRDLRIGVLVSAFLAVSLGTSLPSSGGLALTLSRSHVFGPGVNYVRSTLPLRRLPLHSAARHGSPSLCVELIQGGAMVDQADEDGHTPLHIA